MAVVTNPDQQEEVGLLVHNGSKEKYPSGPLGCLLVLRCLSLTVDRHATIPHQDEKVIMPTTNTTPKMKAWVTSPGKPPRLLRC